MPMTALETFPRITEQQRARSEQLAPCCGAALERPRDDHGNAYARVLFLEWPIVWTERAHAIRDVPAWTIGKDARGRGAARVVLFARGECLLQGRGNFPQDAPRLSPYRGFSTLAAEAFWPFRAIPIRLQPTEHTR
jgi:hypothetical protein